ncbi:hypothetical protein O6H91_Y496700 [Diphasiastrum complanatum]|nr:hypothetical protein O6H91_Y496700 [Diphasiastrum complanatum]
MLRHLTHTALFARILDRRSPLLPSFFQSRASSTFFHSSAAGLNPRDDQEGGEVEGDGEQPAEWETEEIIAKENLEEDVELEASRPCPVEDEEVYEGDEVIGEVGEHGDMAGEGGKANEGIEAEIYLSRKIIYVDKPDHSAAHLSNVSKEPMYKLHKENPIVNSVDKLAADYRIRKQRLHAILWLKEIEKKGEEELEHPLEDDIEKDLEELFTPRVSSTVTYPKYEAKPEGWEGNIKSEAQMQAQLSAKEEQMLVEEFEQRMNFNKKQIAGFVRNHIMSRRRPVDGWSYMVEELGLERKRGTSGGHRFAVEPDGTRRKVNDLEKDFLGREKVRPRRRSSAR